MESKLKERKFKEDIRMKKYLSPKEVEKLYGMSEKWLANLRYQKKWIPYCKVGGKVLYKAEDIEKFIEQHKIKVIDE